MYEEMTFEAVQEAMLGRVRENVDKREGSIIWDATAAVSYYLAECYFRLSHYQDLMLPDTAVGEYLDRVVQAYNLTRKQEVKAVRKISSESEIEIGTRWQLQDTSYLITDTIGELEYIAECEQSGNIGNLYFGTLQPLNNAVQGDVILGEVLTNGTDEEEDDSLRERLLAKIRRPSTSGNVHDYYNWAMSCNGVGAARIFPLADGRGMVKVIIMNEEMEAADTQMIRQVADFIETVRPIGADVKVESARELAVNVNARVKLSKATNLGIAESAFQVSVEEYLKKIVLDIGYVSVARMGNLLMGITGVEDYMELEMNGNKENVTVSDEEVAVVGTIRLEVMT